MFNNERSLLAAINASTCWGGDKIGTQFLAFAFDLNAALAEDVEPVLSGDQSAASAAVGSSTSPPEGGSMSAAVAVISCVTGAAGLAVVAKLISQKRAKPEGGGLIEDRDTMIDAAEATHENIL